MSMIGAFRTLPRLLRQAIITLVCIFGMVAWWNAWERSANSEVNDFEQDYALGCALRRGLSPALDVPSLVRACDEFASPRYAQSTTPHPLILSVPFAPFTFFTLETAKRIFFFIQILFVYSLARFIAGWWSQTPRVTNAWLLTILLPLARPINTVLELGNLSLILLIITACGIRAAAGGATVKGGALIGTAAAAKLGVIPLLLFGALKKEWRMLGGAAAVVAGSLLVSALTFGPAEIARYFTVTLGSEGRLWQNEFANQSLFAWGARLFDGAMSQQNDSQTVTINSLIDAPSLAGWGGFGVTVIFLAVVFFLYRRAKFSSPAWMVFLAASAICTPIAWEHSLIFATPLFTVLAARIFSEGSSLRAALFLIIVGMLMMGGQAVALLTPENGRFPFVVNFVVLAPQLAVVAAIFWAHRYFAATPRD